MSTTLRYRRLAFTVDPLLCHRPHGCLYKESRGNLERRDRRRRGCGAVGNRALSFDGGARFSKGLRKTRSVFQEVVVGCGKRGEGARQGPSSVFHRRPHPTAAPADPQPDGERRWRTAPPPSCLSCGGQPGLVQPRQVRGDQFFLVVPLIRRHQPVDHVVAFSGKRNERCDGWLGVP